MCPSTRSHQGPGGEGWASDDQCTCVSHQRFRVGVHPPGWRGGGGGCRSANPDLHLELTESGMLVCMGFNIDKICFIESNEIVRCPTVALVGINVRWFGGGGVDKLGGYQTFLYTWCT